MRALRRLLMRLVSTPRCRDEARFREELDAHLEMRTAEHVRAGLSSGEARRRRPRVRTDRVLLRPLPVSKPHELVYVTEERFPTQPNARFSYPFYMVLRDNTVLNGLAARAAHPLNLTVNGQTVRATASSCPATISTSRASARSLAGLFRRTTTKRLAPTRWP